MTKRKIEEILALLGYVSPHGNLIPNPVLVTRQIDVLRATMQRFEDERQARQNSYFEPNPWPMEY